MWSSQYPLIEGAWRGSWAKVRPMFSFPRQLRHAVYTINTMESFNMTLRKIVKDCSFLVVAVALKF